MKIKEPFIPLPLARFSSEILASHKSFIKISPTLAKESLISTQSKLIGAPYWPKPILEFPKDIKGGLMKMIAQINFEDIHKAIGPSDLAELFPQNGLLQFFLPRILEKENLWGVCWDDKGNQSNNIAVVYHPEIDLPDLLPIELKEEIQSEINYLFPVYKECELNFSLESEFCSLVDEYHAEHFYGELLNTLSVQEKNEFDDAEEFDSSGSKILGYAHFIQGESRTEKYDENNPWVLLLQIDSFEINGDNVCAWGDDGVGNWFIRKNDLIKRDFSKVVFHWDCY